MSAFTLPRKLLAAFGALALVSCSGSHPIGAEACTVPTSGAGWVSFGVVLSGPGGTGSTYQLQAAGVDGFPTARLDSGGGNAYSPAWHAASGKIAYSATRNGALRLLIRDLSSCIDTLINSGEFQVSNPAISPSGTSIAFEGRGPTGEPDIYLIPIGGGTPTPLTTDLKVDAGPAWAPGDSAIYFVSNRTGVFDIWSVDSSGLIETRITTNSDILGKPSVSPDGKQLAYARWAPGGTEVVILTLAGGAKRVIGLPDDTEPAFDSTGTKLAVRTSRFGGNDIVILDATTGALLSRVTDGSYRAGLPAFPR
jgi:TolB protein